MPNQDGSLTGSDNITLTQMLNRIIPVENSEMTAGSLGLQKLIEDRANNDPPSRTALLRIIDALSLDLMAHAVGGFTAMTEEEQIAALHNVETSLPLEFNTMLGIVRDVYYADDRTPDKPTSFDTENEAFGKIDVEDELMRSTSSRRGKRK
ncbi:MAG: gluconate 2-dehydrogenase subunit 3 family protein [Chloroflexi bacterium]|nr:gluconate 2-dehydrogenase subunit 3 family protein [Chloroflexota bacterium]